MQARSMLLATLVAALWGGNFIAAKLATREFSPLLLLALRFLITGLLMLPLAGRLPRRSLVPVLMVSVTLGVLHFGLMFAGVQRIDVGISSIAAQLGVPFSTLLAVLLFRDRLGWRRLLGVTIAFAGVVVLAGVPGAVDDLPGLGLVVAGAFAWAVANAVIKHYGPFDTHVLTAWMALLATPQLLGLSLLLEDGQWQSVIDATWVGWGALAYTVVGSTIVAYSLWYWLINTNPVSHVVPFTLLAPVFAVAAAVLLLGEQITLPLLIGGAMTIAGVGLCELRWRRVRPRGRQPDVAVPPE